MVSRRVEEREREEEDEKEKEKDDRQLNQTFLLLLTSTW